MELFLFFGLIAILFITIGKLLSTIDNALARRYMRLLADEERTRARAILRSMEVERETE